MKKITENNSNYRYLEKMNSLELVSNINNEDKTVAYAVEKKLVEIAQLVDIIAEKMEGGGRLFYIGAGTSGRLGILDASECPPTFGVDHDWVIGLIAGGDAAIRKAVEHAEDSPKLAMQDLREFKVSSQDIVVGIAASGTTPYVVHGLKNCQTKGITTACITCNPGSPLAQIANYPIEVIVGPEFVTGSTRMKSGTAQKMVLNMISTAVMIKLGRVSDNKMVDMQLSNNKLKDRGTKMLVHALGISYEKAKSMLLKHGSVRAAIKSSDKEGA